MTHPFVHEQQSYSSNGTSQMNNWGPSSECRVKSNPATSEHPIPRLFIILPESTGRTWRPSNKISKQQQQQHPPQPNRYRLHFLCESGVHRVHGGCGSLLDMHGVHKIHMTDHPGYPITPHTKFLKEHGSSILAMTRVLAMVLRIRLQTPSYRELGLEEPSEFLMQSRVTDTMEEALLDPLSMEGFLSSVDKEGTFGNLARIVTFGGQVQWSCSKHLV